MKLRIYIAGLFAIFAAFFIIILCACIVDIKADNTSAGNSLSDCTISSDILSASSSVSGADLESADAGISDETNENNDLDSESLSKLQTNYNTLVTRYNNIISKCKGTALADDSQVKEILSTAADIISEIGDTDLNAAEDEDITDLSESIDIMNEILDQLSTGLNIETDSSDELSVNYEKPDFSVTTTGGDTFTLSEQGGNVVVLNFFATWCGPCKEEMPILQKINDTYSDSGVKVISICSGDNNSSTKSFMSSNSLTFMAAGDPDGAISSDYGVYSIPYTVIFNKDGSIAAEFDGLYSESDYIDAVEAAISK